MLYYASVPEIWLCRSVSVCVVGAVVVCHSRSPRMCAMMGTTIAIRCVIVIACSFGTLFGLFGPMVGVVRVKEIIIECIGIQHPLHHFCERNNKCGGRYWVWWWSPGPDCKNVYCCARCFPFPSLLPTHKILCGRATSHFRQPRLLPRSSLACCARKFRSAVALRLTFRFAFILSSCTTNVAFQICYRTVYTSTGTHTHTHEYVTHFAFFLFRTPI